ncbi:MAG: protein-L-isoaspartate(D-aspartate) O-methyltransferase [Opitutaceae bacterium]
MKRLHAWLLPLLALGMGGVLLSAEASDAERFETQRQRMVDDDIAARGVKHAATLNALRKAPRHRFVPDEYVDRAYGDHPLPIGHGQTISQPYIVAYMTAQIQPAADDRVLEVGAGSGYQAAVLAQIVDEVYTMEIVPELAESARKLLLNDLEYENISVRQGDGYHGWPDAAPFDAIVVTAASESIPPPLIAQLKEGGRMIIPVGPALGAQHLVLVTKEGGRVRTRTLMPVRFVPFTREP